MSQRTQSSLNERRERTHTYILNQSHHGMIIAHLKVSKTNKISYRKQIVCRHSCHQKFKRGLQCKIFLTSSLITLQKLVAVSVRARRRSQKFGGHLDPAALIWGRDWPLETRPSYTCVTMLNLVALGQTVWASVHGAKHGRRWDTRA